MKFDDFFAVHPVFTVDDLKVSFMSQKGVAINTTTLHNLLTYHQKRGHIGRIRRGLYYTIPKGTDAAHCSVDAFLVASKLAKDVVIAYGSALGVYGRLHSMQSRIVYLTQKRVMSSFDFQDMTYQAVAIPAALRIADQKTVGVQSVDRFGQHILVTSLERTVVDVLDRPYLCGSWEEIWRSLETIEYLDLDQVLKYAFLLANATTIVKLGFFLEMHRDALMVSEQYLEELRKHRPAKPHYMDRIRNEPQKLVSKWNLVVPSSLLNRSWEEPHADV